MKIKVKIYIENSTSYNFKSLTTQVSRIFYYMESFKKSSRHCIAQMNEIFSKVKEIESSNNGSPQVKGFKKKEGKKGTKRWKGWGSTASQIQEHMVLTY